MTDTMICDSCGRDNCGCEDCGYCSSGNQFCGKHQPSMRYQIYAIADGECTHLKTQLLDESGELTEAKELAAKWSYLPFGAGILDTQADLIDWGLGFGVAVPDVAE